MKTFKEYIFKFLEEARQPKIIIIGGAGYIGTVLTDYLLKKNNQIICIDNLIYKNRFSIDSFKIG